MKVSLAEIERLCVNALVKKGLHADEAAIVARNCLDAEMRGRYSHGLAVFGVLVSDAAKRGRAVIRKDIGHLVLFEGNGDMGDLVARRALDLLFRRVATNGFVVASMRQIRRFATLGPIAREGAEAGLITIVAEYGGKPYMAPPGAVEPVISTNPLAIGIPSAGEPYVLDMATSEKAHATIRLARARGETIPSSWGIDERGVATDIASQIAAVLPFGGYKGYALALALEVLTGPLLDVPAGLDGDLSTRGALILVVDPTAFGSETNQFQDRVATLFGEVRSAKVTPGSEPSEIPGHRAQRAFARAREAGSLDVDDEVWRSLCDLAKGDED